MSTHPEGQEPARGLLGFTEEVGRAGDKSDVQIKRRSSMDSGFVFVSTNYRLLPNVDMATIVRDVAKSVHWCMTHSPSMAVIRRASDHGAFRRSATRRVDLHRRPLLKAEVYRWPSSKDACLWMGTPLTFRPSSRRRRLGVEGAWSSAGKIRPSREVRQRTPSETSRLFRRHARLQKKRAFLRSWSCMSPAIPIRPHRRCVSAMCSKPLTLRATVFAARETTHTKIKRGHWQARRSGHEGVFEFLQKAMKQ